MRSNKIKRTRRGNAQRKTMRRKTQKRKNMRRKTQKRKTQKRKTMRRKTQKRKRMRRLRGGGDLHGSVEVGGGLHGSVEVPKSPTAHTFGDFVAVGDFGASTGAAARGALDQAATMPDAASRRSALAVGAQAIVGYGNLESRGSTRYKVISGILKVLNGNEKFFVDRKAIFGFKSSPEGCDVDSHKVLQLEFKRDNAWVEKVSELTYLEVKKNKNRRLAGMSEEERLNELSLWLVSTLSSEDEDQIRTPTEKLDQRPAPRPADAAPTPRGVQTAPKSGSYFGSYFGN